MYLIDQLYEAAVARGPVCVGLDTAPEYLPERVLRGAPSRADAVARYNEALIDATADLAACFKVQIAYYEALGCAGLAAYARTLRCLRGRGLLAIADIKRGDIADTAARYAAAHFSGDFEADFVTLSPWMGMDSIQPWLRYAETAGKGAFVLLRTSNPGARDFQALEIANDEKARRVFDVVGERLCALAAQYRGACGYGAFGAVVGCTDAAEAGALRARYRDLFFLVPGYGAQGGSASCAAALSEGGRGGVVNASRSLLKAWQREASETGRGSAEVGLAFAAEAARKECAAMRDALAQGAE
jgi:orotidine-5'-phosphate decarboxylase